MSTFQLLVLIVCAFALVEEASPSTDMCVCAMPGASQNCCMGLIGSTNAPAQFPDAQSPAGGPAGNPYAVVCYYYRGNGCLICRKGDKTAKCCTASTKEKDDTQEYGPTPYNEYLIETKSKRENKERFKLRRRIDGANSGYFKYSVNGLNIRDKFDIRPGKKTRGRVTVLDDNDCWEKIKEVIQAGKMKYTPVGRKRAKKFEGFLYVV